MPVLRGLVSLLVTHWHSLRALLGQAARTPGARVRCGWQLEVEGGAVPAVSPLEDTPVEPDSEPEARGGFVFLKAVSARDSCSCASLLPA